MRSDTGDDVVFTGEHGCRGQLSAAGREWWWPWTNHPDSDNSGTTLEWGAVMVRVWTLGLLLWFGSGAAVKPWGTQDSCAHPPITAVRLVKPLLLWIWGRCCGQSGTVDIVAILILSCSSNPPSITDVSPHHVVPGMSQFMECNTGAKHGGEVTYYFGIVHGTTTLEWGAAGNIC